MKLNELFCGRFNCKPEQFEEQAFQKCLPTHAKILAPVIRVAAPVFFAADLQMIRYLGDTSTWRDARSEIHAFQEGRRSAYSFLRDTLRLRVSGQKATFLALDLLHDEAGRSD